MREQKGLVPLMLFFCLKNPVRWVRFSKKMDIVMYSLFAYGLTAVISLMVMGVVIMISKTLGNNNVEQEIE